MSPSAPVLAVLLSVAWRSHTLRTSDESEINMDVSNSDTALTDGEYKAFAKWNQRVVGGAFTNSTSSFLEAANMPTPQDIEAREDYRIAPVWEGLLEDGAKKVGAGTFGTTFLAKSPCSGGQKVAVKQVVGDSWSELSKEIIIQSQLDHANVAQVFDYYPRTSTEWHHPLPGRARLFSIMMELLPNGELSETMLCGNKKVRCNDGQQGCFQGKMSIPTPDACKGNELPFADIDTRKRYIAETGLQLLRGIQYVTNQGIGHRDLKPENVMVIGENCVADPAGCQVKIIDFGLACDAAHGDTTCGQAAGTPMFIPPDVYQGANAPYAHDAYSVGMMLFQMWHAQADYVNGVAVSTRPGREGKQEHPWYASYPVDMEGFDPHSIGHLTHDDWITFWDPKLDTHAPILKTVIMGLLRVSARPTVYGNQPRMTVQDAISLMTRFYEEDAYARVVEQTVPVQIFENRWDPMYGPVRVPVIVHQVQRNVVRTSRNDASAYPAATPPLCVGQCVAKQCSFSCQPSTSSVPEPYCTCPSPMIAASDGRSCKSEGSRATCACSTTGQTCAARFETCAMAGVQPYCEVVMAHNRLPSCNGLWITPQEKTVQDGAANQIWNPLSLRILEDWKATIEPQCGRWKKGAQCSETGPDGRSFVGTCQAILMERNADAEQSWNYIACDNGRVPPEYASYGDAARCAKNSPSSKYDGLLEMYGCLPSAVGTPCVSQKYFYGYTTKSDYTATGKGTNVYDFHAHSPLPSGPLSPGAIKGSGCGPKLRLRSTGEVEATPMICADKRGNSLDDYGPGFRGVCMEPLN